ncbi:dihydrolipoamide acetyltransferase family protein [Streptosporangium carneum]|nr:dihydrolipoamide acetyltransferase family protein [Streptosporangium carneum]
MGELRRFALPDVGEGLIEADIVKWHVRPGDAVEVNQTILEIETAKAVVELPCPFEGTVVELLVAEGTTVDVGVPLITVAVGGDVPSPPAETPPAPAPSEALSPVSPGTASAVAPAVAGTAPGRDRVPVLVGYGVKPGSTTRRPRRADAVEPEAVRPDAGTASRAKPPVRKLARDLGVDLAALTGTGPQGSVTRDDVRLAAAVAEAGPTVAEEDPRAERRVPVRGVRKHTAAAMVRSAFTAPHVTTWSQVDVTETTGLLAGLRDLADFADVRISPLLPVAKALLVAVRRNPLINSSWDEEAQEIVVKRHVNLGVAAATERGLIVPNVKDADTLPLPELARALAELAAMARAGRASPRDLSGGTITITNVGVFGVDGGTPILTPGESAILALGQIRDVPWVHEGEIKIRKVTTLALSFDHRVVDGELGSAVLREVGAMLENPTLMLAWA